MVWCAFVSSQRATNRVVYALQFAWQGYRREFAYSSLHKSIENIWCELLLALSSIIGLNECSSHVGNTARLADMGIRRHFSDKDNANISDADRNKYVSGFRGARTMATFLSSFTFSKLYTSLTQRSIVC